MVLAVKEREGLNKIEAMRAQQAEDGELMKEYFDGRVDKFSPVKVISFFDSACLVLGHMAITHHLSSSSHTLTSKLNLLGNNMRRGNPSILPQEIAEELVRREFPVVWEYMEAEQDDCIAAVPTDLNYRFSAFWAGGRHNITRVYHYLGGMPYFVAEWGIPGVCYEGINVAPQEVQ